MSTNPENDWAYVEAGEDDPFAEVPFQEEAPPEEFAVEAAQVQEVAPITADADKKDATVANIPAAPVEDNSDIEEAKKRAAHEAAEAQRKAEFDARQAAKKKAKEEQIARVQNMNDDEAMAAAIQRTGADTEKLTRINMKQMVTEHIQTLCIEDSAFARLALQPRKSMIHCFQFISRKAWEYVQDELKANGIQPGPGMQAYGTDIPDDLCYQWAEEYFRDPTVKEDEEKEEQFVPKPYPGKAAPKTKVKKPAEKKKAEKKVPEKKPEVKKPAEDDQLSFGQMAMI